MYFVSSHTIRRNVINRVSWFQSRERKYYHRKERFSRHGSPRKSQIIANSLPRKVTFQGRWLDIGLGNLELPRSPFGRLHHVKFCEHVSYDADLRQTFDSNFYWWSRLEFVKKPRFPHAACIDRTSDRGTPKQRIASGNWSHLSDLPLCFFLFLPSVLELWCDLSVSENLLWLRSRSNWQL